MPSVGTRRSDTKVLSSLKRTTPGRSPIERHHACPPQGVHSTLLYRNCIDRRASYRGGFQRRPVPYRERRPAVFDRHQPAPSRNRWPWGALRFPQGLFGPAITVLKSKSVLTVEGQHALLVVDYQRRNQTTSLRRRRAKTRRPAHAAVTALPPKGGPQAG